MRKSFTRLFGFLLLSVMMLFSYGLYALPDGGTSTETQSTIELKASTVTQCYNLANSYSVDVQVKDFITMKSFDLTLKYDPAVFSVGTVVPVAALQTSGFTWSITGSDPVTGKLNIKWSSPTAVTYADNAFAKLFTVNFKVANPSATATSYASTLVWDSSSYFYYSSNWAAGTTYQTNTTAYTAGSISVPVNISADAIQVSTSGVTCSGNSAIITVTSPVGAGYTYYFNGSSTGSATPTATATAPSTNQVVVVDAAGCASLPKSFTVDSPAALAYSVATSTAACYQGNGAITFSPSGSTGPYTYWVVPASDWSFVQNLILAYSPGGWNVPALAPYQYTTAQVLKPAGWYYVNVNSATNCNPMGYPTANPSWQLVNITAPSAISVSTTKVDQTCTAKGSITVTQVLGGTASPTGSYLVSIDNVTWKQITASTTSATFPDLVGGTYTVTAIDSKGCVGTSVVKIKTPAPILFAVAYTDASCFEGTTGSATVSVTNDNVGTYQYAIPLQSAGYTVETIGTASVTWEVAGNTTASGTITTGLVPNYYSVFVRNTDTGCIAAYNSATLSGNIVPIQKPDKLGFDASFSAVTCAGTATITVTATGGHTPYSYVFGEDAATVSNTKTYTLEPEESLTVSVTVIDGGGVCSITQSVSIEAPATLSATISATDVVLSPSCPGGTNGRATVLASGGSAPYYFASDGSTFRENNVVAVREGTTTITVKDSNGCTIDVYAYAATVTPTTISVATPAKISCVGGTTSLSVTGTWPADRSVLYYYSKTKPGSDLDAWYNSATAFVPYATGTLPAATGTPTTFTAGVYYIGAKDKLFDCEAAVTSVTISENPALAATVVKVKDATCAGLYDGILTVSTTGGTGTVTYSLGNTANQAKNGTFQNMDTYSSTTQTSKKTLGLSRGTYYVVVMDQCGASAPYGPYSIDGYKPITFDGKVGTTPSTCFDSKDGKITVPLASVHGGKPEFDNTGLYTFTLSKPDGKTASNTTGSFTGLVGGSYTITITDASQCTSSAVIPVSFEDPKQLLVTGVLVKNISCKGLNNGEITVTTNGGGVPAYKMAINSTADGAYFPFGTDAATSKPYVATQPGTFMLYVKDAHDCPANTVSVTVSEPEALTASVTVSGVTCSSGGTGTATVAAVGGWSKLVGTVTSTYTYGVDAATSSATAVFGSLAVGTHTASVVDITGTTTVVVATTTATITYTYPAISCKATATFAVEPLKPYLYSGVASAVKCYNGNDGALLVTVLQGSQATVVTTGKEYYVQLTSTTTPTLAASDWKLTKNQKYEFTGLVHGHYTVWISSANTVAGTATGTNSIYNQGACVLPVGSEPFNQNQSGPYMYAESWEIQQPSTALTASGTWVSDVACDGSKNGSFTVNAVGGSTPYTYAAKRSIYTENGVVKHVYVSAPDPTSSEWQSANLFENRLAGTWIVWAKDSNGCVVGGETDTTTGLPVDKYRVVIQIPAPIAFTAVKTADVTCYGANNGKITITPADATRAPFTYVITGTDYTGAAVSISGVTTSTVQASYVITGIPANTTSGTTATNVYTVTLTDRNNCTASSTTLVSVVKQPQQLTATLVKAAGMFTCPGDISGVIELQNLGGGTKDYKYQLWRDGVQYSPTTGYGVIPSFIVGVGYTYKAVVEDALGCQVSSTIVLNAPKAVQAEMAETTCFGDPTASVIIKATGEAGRTFQYRSRLNTDPAFADATTGWAAVTSQPVSGFIFANVNPTQNFYYFEIKDSEGCTTSKTYSFVPTQIKLTATVAGIGGSATVTVAGGISPYAYAVGSAAKADWTGSVSGGSYPVIGLVDGANTINVFDAHGCVVSPALTYTADLTAPTATYTPNGTATPTEDNYPTLVVKFSEDVAIGAGNVKINKVSDGSTVVTIPASAITVSGSTATLVYAGGLDKDTQYYVTIDAGVVKDLANNNFAGVTSSSTWTFKTGNKFKTDVPDPVNTLEFKVYPNPFVDYVTIANASELSKVVVSNIAGQVVKEVAYPTATLQLSELRSGVYFVTLYQDEKVVNTVKLLKR